MTNDKIRPHSFPRYDPIHSQDTTPFIPKIRPHSFPRYDPIHSHSFRLTITGFVFKAPYGTRSALPMSWRPLSRYRPRKRTEGDFLGRFRSFSLSGGAGRVKPTLWRQSACLRSDEQSLSSTPGNAGAEFEPGDAVVQ